MNRIILAILCFILLTGCGVQNTNPVINSVQAKTTDRNAIYLMAGKVQAETKADLTTKISAKVSEILVDIGSQVKKGDPLIKLDMQDLEAQFKQAEAAVSTAQANLLKAKNGARPEQKVQAESAVESAQKDYETAKSNYDRLQQLFEAGSISEQQIETAEDQMIAAQAQYTNAKAQLDIINNGETKETIDILESQVEQTKAALEVVKAQLDNATLASPVTGVVSAKNINIGELAVAGSTLISVVNTEQMEIDAYLPVRLMGKVKSGEEVAVKISEIPDRIFQGEIRLIDPVIPSGAKDVLVKVSIKEKDPRMKPGMFAEIGFYMEGGKEDE